MSDSIARSAADGHDSSDGDVDGGVDDAAVSDASASSGSESGRVRTAGWLLLAAFVMWLASLFVIDLREMTDVGLVSVLPWSFFVALALLTVGFLYVNEYVASRRLLVSGYLVLLSAMAHATPALLSGDVRYAWSYRHLGVVDFIGRNGGVAAGADFQQIDHAWPGMPSLTALLADVTGLAPSTIAVWTPFAVSLLSLLALSVVYRSFVGDPRVWSLALWLFVVANWVGQEYFSPQAAAYVFYLALLAIVIPFDRKRRSRSGHFELRAGDDFRPTDSGNVVVSILGVLIVIAITGTHQLTPIMVIVTFGILSAFRVVRSTWVSLAALGAGLVWLVGPALAYVQSDDADPADRFGLPAENPDVTSASIGDISVGHAIVVIADRFLTLAVVALAIFGIIAIRHRPQSRLLLALCAAPLVLLVTGDVGEAIFRAYLFALPWLALAASYALRLAVDRYAFAIRIGVRSLVVSVLLVTFLFAYFGEERSHQFTDAERDLVGWIQETAPPNSLLIEGSRNYPGRAQNEERFFYVPLSRETEISLAALDADPEVILHAWMTDDRYAASYLVVTRSMRDEQRSVPSMPTGLLERIESTLIDSDRFRVAERNGDGIVFVLAEQGA